MACLPPPSNLVTKWSPIKPPRSSAPALSHFGLWPSVGDASDNRARLVSSYATVHERFSIVRPVDISQHSLHRDGAERDQAR